MSPDDLRDSDDSLDDITVSDLEEMDDEELQKCLDALELKHDPINMPLSIVYDSTTEALEYAEQTGQDPERLINGKVRYTQLYMAMEPTTYEDRQELYTNIRDDIRWLLDHEEEIPARHYKQLVGTTIEQYMEKIEKTVLRY